VGDWVLLLSADGIQQNATPYLVKAIEQGPDGHFYVQFAETLVGWPIDQCEKAEPLTPSEAFDALYEGMLDAQEEAQMRQYFPPPEKATNGSPGAVPDASAPGLPFHGPTSAQGCPECGAHIWHQRLTYRECQHCKYKDGLTPQEILKQGEGRT